MSERPAGQLTLDLYWSFRSPYSYVLCPVSSH